MKLIFLLAAIVVVYVCCSSKNDFEKGKKQLEIQGYFNVKNTGFDWFCCGDDDFSTGFTAMSVKDSTVVKGCMCSGALGKGITIRFK